MTDDIRRLEDLIHALNDKVGALDKTTALQQQTTTGIREDLGAALYLLNGADNPAPLRTEVPRIAQQAAGNASQIARIMARLDASKIKEVGALVMQALGFGDRAKRGWLLPFVLGLALLTAAGYGAFSFLTDPTEREHEREMDRLEASEERLERRRRFTLDSLAAVRNVQAARTLGTLADEAGEDLSPASDTVATVLTQPPPAP